MFHPVEEQDESVPIRPSRRRCNQGTSATELERPRSFTGLLENPRATRKQHREGHIYSNLFWKSAWSITPSEKEAAAVPMPPPSTSIFLCCSLTGVGKWARSALPEADYTKLTNRKIADGRPGCSSSNHLSPPNNRRSEVQLPTHLFKEISTHLKLFQTPSSDLMSYSPSHKVNHGQDAAAESATSSYSLYRPIRRL
ncbi:unnamed protein product [Pleuronectes platessa]|uniref:Uncharacterized protein n=1 Tax=Pleuronectes platessa TaxID=8262 RepID=A0A9N7TYP8_PLEPL|nr:unnamed protein product [Pleuronectes platessa]